jgi:hypothetical protein
MANSISAGWFCNAPNGLNPGETRTCEGMIDIPATQPLGSFFFTAIADDTNQLTLSTRDGTVRQNSNGVTAITGTGAVTIETAHPYSDNMDTRWTYTVPGNPSQIRVTFDERTSFEQGYDFLFVTDSRGIGVAGSPFTGRSLAGRTLTIPGATVNLRFVTDDSIVDWGFRITNIVAASGDTGFDAAVEGNLREGIPYDLNSGENSPEPSLTPKRSADPHRLPVSLEQLRDAKPGPEFPLSPDNGTAPAPYRSRKQ